MKGYYYEVMARITDEAIQKAKAAQKKAGFEFPFLIQIEMEMAKARIIEELMRPLVINPLHAVEGGVWMDYLNNRKSSFKNILNY